MAPTFSHRQRKLSCAFENCINNYVQSFNTISTAYVFYEKILRFFFSLIRVYRIIVAIKVNVRSMLISSVGLDNMDCTHTYVVFFKY